MQQNSTKIQSPINPLISPADINGSGDQGVKVHKWTQKEYYKMADLGFFRGKRVELIEGEIIEMAPMKSPHATSVTLVTETLRDCIGKNYYVRNQSPMSFSKSTEPEPDAAIIKGKVRDFAKAHPKIAELIVEVSDATLTYDRGRKASIYARNKIQDYWIVNLKDRSLEVYRQPKRDKKSGFIYSQILIFREEDTVSPLAFPKAKIKIADLLP